jgi:NAD(P)-dependent dehydrogenase (short-subunit alcohol dehydrogenase family)
MAYELGRENIIVNAISPGPIDTGRSLARSPELTRELMDKVPLGRFGEAEEIAELAFYLASSSPAFLQDRTSSSTAATSSTKEVGEHGTARSVWDSPS